MKSFRPKQLWLSEAQREHMLSLRPTITLRATAGYKADNKQEGTRA